MSIDDDEYEDRDNSMTDNDFNSMYTIDIKRTLIACIPNFLSIGLTFYFLFIFLSIISNFEDPGLQFMGLLIMGYAALKIFPKLVIYKLMYKDREIKELDHISFEGQIKANNFEYDK